jgi:hypothetical protein
VPWPTFGAGEYRVNGLGCNINGLLFPLVKWFHLGFGALGESGAPSEMVWRKLPKKFQGLSPDWIIRA